MPYMRMLPFLIVLAVVLFNGLKPEPVPQLFDQQDKLHHLLGFAALAFTLRLAFPRVGLAGGSTPPPPPSKRRPSLGSNHSSRPPSRVGSVPRADPARACGSTSSPSTSFSLCCLFSSCSLSVVDCA